MAGFKSQHAVLKVKVKFFLFMSCKHREDWRCVSTHSSPALNGVEWFSFMTWPKKDWGLQSWP